VSVIYMCSLDGDTCPVSNSIIDNPTRIQPFCIAYKRVASFCCFHVILSMAYRARRAAVLAGGYQICIKVVVVT